MARKVFRVETLHVLFHRARVLERLAGHKEVSAQTQYLLQCFFFLDINLETKFERCTSHYL